MATETDGGPRRDADHAREAGAVVLGARRRRRRSRSGAEPLLTASLRELVECMLEAAGGGSAGPLERRLDELVAVAVARGFDDGGPLLEIAEAEHTLVTVSRSLGRPLSPADSARVVRHAEEYFLARLAAFVPDGRGAGEQHAVELLEAIPHTVFVLDGELRVRYVNDHVRELFRCSPSELLGQRFEEILVPRVLRRLAEPHDFLAGTRRLLESPQRRHEDVFRDRSGVTYVRRSIPVELPEAPGCLIVLTAIGVLPRRRLRPEAPSDGDRGGTAPGPHPARGIAAPEQDLDAAHDGVGILGRS